MSQHKRYAAALCILVALGGCGDKEEAPAPGPTAEEIRQTERANNEKAAKEEAQRMLTEEKQKREREEKSTEFWRMIGLLGVIGAVAAALFGISLGSSARKKAERARRDDQQG